MIFSFEQKIFRISKDTPDFTKIIFDDLYIEYLSKESVTAYIDKPSVNVNCEFLEIFDKEDRKWEKSC